MFNLVSFLSSEIVGLTKYNRPYTEIGLHERSKDLRSRTLGLAAIIKHSLAVKKVEFNARSRIG